MRNLLKKYYLRYYLYSEQRTPVAKSDADIICKWRDKFFLQIIMVITPLSFIVFIFSLIPSISEKLIVVSVFDTFTFLAILFIYFSKKTAVRKKKKILLIILYFLGLILLIYLGPGGPAFSYLLAVSIFASLIISSKSGFIALLFNIINIIGIIILIQFDKFNFLAVTELDAKGLIAIGSNFILLNFALIISLNSLLKTLSQSAKKETKTRNELIEQNQQYKIAVQEAEESNRLKSEFLANMSHEIRTPLNGIIGFSELLTDMNISKEEQVTYVRTIQKSSHQLLSTMTDIVDASKITSGQLKLYPSLTNLNDILIEFHNKQLSNLSDYKAKNISFTLTLPPNCSPTLMIDTDRLVRVLEHITMNAIQHTREGYIDIGYHINADAIIPTIDIYIRDSGLGIDATEHNSIFEVFTHAQSKEFHEGNGLGLSICKGIIDLWEGKIWVQSEKGKGSTFFFSIPI